MLTDDELRPQVLSLYESGKGIRSIVRSLHSSEARVRRILKEGGVETALRSNRVVPTHKHPYKFNDVMEEKGWSTNLVCERLKVGKKMVTEWRRDGLPWEKADEVAIRMGFMPEELGWVDRESELLDA